MALKGRRRRLLLPSLRAYARVSTFTRPGEITMGFGFTRRENRLAIARTVGVTLAIGLMLPAFVAAQNITSASIDGVVSDQSIAALPGVTVTATSPALQVPQIMQTTDGQGHYRFIDL